VRSRAAGPTETLLYIVAGLARILAASGPEIAQNLTRTPSCTERESPTAVIWLKEGSGVDG